MELMYDTSTKGQFLELRAKGWSLARIAAQINVAQRTLVDWNRQHRPEMIQLRAMELEAFQDKLQLTHEEDLARVKKELDRVDAELAKRKIEFVETEDLYGYAAKLRAEIRKVSIPRSKLDEVIAK